MSVPVFLSYPRPFRSVQARFIAQLMQYLTSRDLAPCSLSCTNHDIQGSLKLIHRLIRDSRGIIVIALQRTRIDQAAVRPGTDQPDQTEVAMSQGWLTSPYCQVEAAMAYQLGLPILILREAGVISEGILEHGAVGVDMPEFDAAAPPADYFATRQWNDRFSDWAHSVFDTEQKGIRRQPPGPT